MFNLVLTPDAGLYAITYRMQQLLVLKYWIFERELCFKVSSNDDKYSNYDPVGETDSCTQNMEGMLVIVLEEPLSFIENEALLRAWILCFNKYKVA